MDCRPREIIATYEAGLGSVLGLAQYALYIATHGSSALHAGDIAGREHRPVSRSRTRES